MTLMMMGVFFSSSFFFLHRTRVKTLRWVLVVVVKGQNITPFAKKMEFLSRGRWRWWGSNGHYCTQINLARFKVATDWCKFCNIVERVCRSGQKGCDDLQKIVRWVFHNRSCWDCMEVNLTLNRYEKKLQSMMYCLNSLKTEHLWKFQLPIDSSSDCAFSSWPNAEICPKTILDFFFRRATK